MFKAWKQISSSEADCFVKDARGLWLISYSGKKKFENPLKVIVFLH